MGDQQQQLEWRVCPNTQKTETPEKHRCRVIRRRVGFEYPTEGVTRKAVMLNDLLNHFKKKASQADDPNKIPIKDHHLKKGRRESFKINKLSVKASLMRSEDEGTISQLVNQIKSSTFRITPDAQKDFNVAHGVQTLSCYDTTPREPTVDISNENSFESRPSFLPEVTCDKFYVNDTHQKAPNLELVNQTAGLNMGAIAQNPSGSQLLDKTQSTIDFSRQFREYCINLINPRLNQSLEKFLADLSRLQRNLYNRDNVKGRYRRRFYAGFKEIEKRLQMKKIKFIIVAPDLDKKKDNGELNKLVHRFIDSCKRYEIPVIFGLSRRKLGYLTHGKGFVSCIGIANYEALEDKLEDALTMVLEARNEFKRLNGESNKMIDIKKILTEDLLLSERVKILLKALAFSQ